MLNLATNLPLTLAGVDTDALLRLRAAPQIEGTTETLYDANGAVGQENSIRYTYDRLGNPTLINDRGDPTNPDDDVVAKLTYSDCKNAASYDLDLFFGCSDGLPFRIPTIRTRPIRCRRRRRPQQRRRTGRRISARRTRASR